MDPVTLDSLRAYWSAPEIAANVLIFANLAFALLLGLFVGYERSYHGRAAGMRTYALVCMASAGLMIVTGYAPYWFGGQAHPGELVPTQVIQGIVTGIGFLGAGVIMKEGFNISGLTTAASIWASSSIGILVGVGMYGAAILLTILSAACMMYGGRLEQALPSCPAVAVVVSFERDAVIHVEALAAQAGTCGFSLAPGSLSIVDRAERHEWCFVLVAAGREAMAPMPQLAAALRAVAGVQGVQLSFARN